LFDQSQIRFSHSFSFDQITKTGVYCKDEKATDAFFKEGMSLYCLVCGVFIVRHAFAIPFGLSGEYVRKGKNAPKFFVPAKYLKQMNGLCSTNRNSYPSHFKTVSLKSKKIKNKKLTTEEIRIDDDKDITWAQSEPIDITLQHILSKELDDFNDENTCLVTAHSSPAIISLFTQMSISMHEQRELFVRLCAQPRGNGRLMVGTTRLHNEAAEDGSFAKGLISTALGLTRDHNLSSGKFILYPYHVTYPKLPVGAKVKPMLPIAGSDDNPPDAPIPCSKGVTFAEATKLFEMLLLVKFDEFFKWKKEDFESISDEEKALRVMKELHEWMYVSYNGLGSPSDWEKLFHVLWKNFFGTLPYPKEIEVIHLDMLCYLTRLLFTAVSPIKDVKVDGAGRSMSCLYASIARKPEKNWKDLTEVDALNLDIYSDTFYTMGEKTDVNLLLAHKGSDPLSEQLISSLEQFSRVIQDRMSIAQASGLRDFLSSYVERIEQEIHSEAGPVTVPVDYQACKLDNKELVDKYRSPSGRMQWVHWLFKLKHLPVSMILETRAHNVQLSKWIGNLLKDIELPGQKQILLRQLEVPTFSESKSTKSTTWLLMLMCQNIYYVPEISLPLYNGGKVSMKLDDFAIESFKTFILGNGSAYYDTRQMVLRSGMDVITANVAVIPEEMGQNVFKGLDDADIFNVSVLCTPIIFALPGFCGSILENPGVIFEGFFVSGFTVMSI